MRGLFSKTLEALYQFDVVRALKDRVRPIKHALRGKNDIYFVVDAIKRARRDGRPVATVLDVGAAYGDKTVTFLRAFPNATVHCFEPQTGSRARLARRVARWRERVQIHDYGLFNEDREVDLRLYSYNDASSLLRISEPLRQDGISEVGSERILVKRLDSCLEDLSVRHIDLLKVDVEGVEREVLEGASRALRITDNVFVEIVAPLRKPDGAAEIGAVRELLEKFGFRFIGQFGDHWFSKESALF